MRQAATPVSGVYTVRVVQERIEEILRGMGGMGSAERRVERAQAPAPLPRRGPGLDTGTVALGLTAMTYYWMMPALMSQRKRRRRKRGASQGQPPAQG